MQPRTSPVKCARSPQTAARPAKRRNAQAADTMEQAINAWGLEKVHIQPGCSGKKDVTVGNILMKK